MYHRSASPAYSNPSPPLSPSTTNSSTTPNQSRLDTSTPRSSFPAMSDDDEVLPASPDNSDPSSTPPPPTNLSVVAAPQPPPPARTPAFPSREDCWSEEATHTLIEAWGSFYLELNRGNLRQKHWQEVAAAVNALHGHTQKQRRTDIQCKNRIDTLKKKYKSEKRKVSDSRGRYVPDWRFFAALDSLIGDTYKPSPSLSPATVAPQRKAPVPLSLPPPPSAVPVGPRSKRPANHDSVFRRNFSAMAAAAARMEEEDNNGEDGSESSVPAALSGERKRETEGYKMLADAIGKFGKIYERVEEAKQRQMVELEKQRMQFAKDLELQKMKVIMEWLVQFQKIKRSKHNSEADIYT